MQGKLGGSISIHPIQPLQENIKVDKINLCFWTTTHMIADEEVSMLTAATLDGKLLQWKLVDAQKPSSSLDTTSFTIIGLQDRFSLECTACVLETSLGHVTAFCYNSKRYAQHTCNVETVNNNIKRENHSFY